MRWEQQLRFRHLATRQYLCITTDRRVALTADSKDPRTVFRLHPVIKVVLSTFLPAHVQWRRYTSLGATGQMTWLEDPPPWLRPAYCFALVIV